MAYYIIYILCFSTKLPQRLGFLLCLAFCILKCISVIKTEHGLWTKTGLGLNSLIILVRIDFEKVMISLSLCFHTC